MYRNTFCNVKKSIDEADIKRIEDKYAFTMPYEFKEHYLQYNGGYPEKSVFICNDGSKYVVNYFIPIKNEQEDYNLDTVLNILRYDLTIPDWLIPFADEEGGNLFCFSLRDNELGTIYYYDHEFTNGKNNVRRISNTLETFINSMIENEDV